MGQIIITIAVIIATIFLYNIPVIGALLCILSLILCIKLTRERNFMIGFLGLIVSSVTTLLSFIIILVTFNVIEPIGFDIGYNSFYTNKINGMVFLNDIDDKRERLNEYIDTYVERKTVYGAGGTREATVRQLFMNSSDVKIYYSSRTMEALKDSLDDKTYEKVKSFIATRDSDVDYYLLNFQKLYDEVKPIEKLPEEKWGYWLVDTNGNVYLNVKDFNDYIYN